MCFQGPCFIVFFSFSTAWQSFIPAEVDRNRGAREKEAKEGTKKRMWVSEMDGPYRNRFDSHHDLKMEQANHLGTWAGIPTEIQKRLR